MRCVDLVCRSARSFARDTCCNSCSIPALDGGLFVPATAGLRRACVAAKVERWCRWQGLGRVTGGDCVGGPRCQWYARAVSEACRKISDRRLR